MNFILGNELILKKVLSNDQGWKINIDKSMNKMVSDFVCKEPENKKYKNINFLTVIKTLLQEVGIIVLVLLNLKMAMYMLVILKMANIMEMALILLVQMVIFLDRFILASGYMAREMEQV